MFHVQIRIDEVFMRRARVMQAEESFEVQHPNTDWCNIAGKASDMHVEGSLEAKLPNTH